MPVYDQKHGLIAAWGLYQPPHPCAVAEAKPFPTVKARDAWVKENLTMRSAVGKRHPAVKALRQRWDNERRSAS